MSSDTTSIRLVDCAKTFADGTRALERLSITISGGETVVLLGPSGCGKTTLMGMIAGFEDGTEGTIFLFGAPIANKPPNKRPVNTVFQNYALFPHMDVLENVGFGLTMLGHSKSDADKRAGEMLDLVQLSQFASRKPSQLSGGQQQRVALARALAPQPNVLLLDEPTSALDLKLRKAMQLELKQLQRDTGITFVFVTHDQEEALTMSDRIAVMSDGEVQQLGDAREIYEKPRNRFVASFIGETNLLDVRVVSVADGRANCKLRTGTVIACDAPPNVALGQKAHLSVRPERVCLTDQAPAGEHLTATVRDNIFVGTDITSDVALPDGSTLSIRSSNSERDTDRIYAPDTPVFVTLEAGAARLLTT